MIVPHTKVQMQSVPRMTGSGPCTIWTTGTVTMRNYIQKLAGQKAEFHHTFGALYVEKKADGNWWARQLIASNDGSFQDLNTKYTADGRRAGSIEAINWGDLHSESINQNHLKAMHNMLDVLKPKYQFLHDSLDFRTRNHHNIKDPYHLAQMHHEGRTVVGDLMAAKEVMSRLRRTFCETVVVESNHDGALRQWLQTADIRQDPANALFYHTGNAAIHKAIRDGDENFNVFKWAFHKTPYNGPVRGRLTFLKERDSFVICRKDNDTGIECGNHGHRGPNGARGSMVSFANLGIKTNTGHTHSPYINNGAWGAGMVGKLDQGYNEGPTSWAPANILTYPSGKRAMVFFRGREWRA